ncbi:MAG: hypothetical protein [Caudoviricetes sp.]|nr:MAG: hypothetical protein [Caudoviricetes sp.]
MKEALEFYKKHGLEECKKAYALSVNAGHEDLEMKKVIDAVATRKILPYTMCKTEWNIGEQ